MDLTSPLRSLVPTMESAVLEALAGTESSLSATQVARVAPRGTRTGLTVALDRLTEHGLVIAEPANRGYMYRLNRDHLLYPAVTSALSVRRTLIERLADATAQLQPAPVHVSLFGSFARGEGTEQSDIDLLVVTGDDVDVTAEAWRSQTRDLEDAALSWTGNRLELLTLSVSTLSRATSHQEPVVATMLNDGVRLHGPSLEALVERAQIGGSSP